jgi:YHS domain-containing protein
MESGGIPMEETYGLQDYSDGSPTFTIDPVCGIKIDVSKAAGKTGYAGEMFYFCSPACRRAFDEDPGRYIGQRK